MKKMGKLGKGDRENTQKLVAEVQKRPVLYDTRHPAYKHKVKTDEEWEAVATAMGLPAEALWLVAVAALWGGTNPLLKLTSAGVENIHRESRLSQFVAEFVFLFCNWKYLLSFISNQMGSVLYYVTLASADLTLAVPITNSLTFLFTAISSRALGERALSWEALTGMGLVLCGVVLCVLSKVDPPET